MKCCYCGASKELRPYGPNAAMVCFRCAMSTPERKAETERQFGIQLQHASPASVIDGTETGPYPAEHHPDLKSVVKSSTKPS